MEAWIAVTPDPGRAHIGITVKGHTGMAPAYGGCIATVNYPLYEVLGRWIGDWGHGKGEDTMVSLPSP